MHLLRKHLSQDIRKLLVFYIRLSKDNLNMDLFKLFKSEYAVYKQNQKIYTSSGEDIKQLQNYKLLIMSATLNKDIHISLLNKYLPGKDITWINIANTELKGEIICDCSHAFSRDSLNKPTEKAKQKLEEIMLSTEYTNVITFKNDFEILDFEKYNKNKILYFGKVEGIDAYKGKKLAIIGTPHTNSVYYEMLGALINGGKSPVSKKWEVKNVDFGGYQFPLNTYEAEKDELFTKIQLYCLYSQLIQAVGRARLLRYNTKVYVFSAIPLPGATVIGVKKAKDFKVIELPEEELEYTPENDFEEVMTNEEMLKELGLIS